MAHLHVNDGSDGGTALVAALARLGPADPVIIMLHGFRFSPSATRTDPHRHILSMDPVATDRKALSWPRGIGLDRESALGIAYGWEARGTIWAAAARTPDVAANLARLICRIHAAGPDRPVHLMAHSLGARVAILALHHLPAGAVGRIVLLAAAAFRAETARALNTPAGQQAEVINVSGSENLMFEILLRLALPGMGATLGGGLPTGFNGIDLRLNDPGHLARLAACGYVIAQPRHRVCHWSAYLRPGVWGLYRALLLRPAQTPLPWLRTQITTHLAPTAQIPGSVRQLGPAGSGAARPPANPA